MSLKGRLRFVGQTDTGKVREHNEDTIAFDADIGLLVLADGMGGYNAGEVASGIAVKTIVNLVREQVEREDMNVQDRDSGLSRPTICSIARSARTALPGLPPAIVENITCAVSSGVAVPSTIRRKTVR